MNTRRIKVSETLLKTLELLEEVNNQFSEEVEKIGEEGGFDYSNQSDEFDKHMYACMSLVTEMIGQSALCEICRTERKVAG